MCFLTVLRFKLNLKTIARIESASLWYRRLLLAQNSAREDEMIVDSLLSLLHTPVGLTETKYQPYLITNTLIKTYPILMWPMLLRAEAWLATRKTLRDNWGGKRE